MAGIFEKVFSLCYYKLLRIINKRKIPGLSFCNLLTINMYEFTKSTKTLQKDTYDMYDLL